MKPLSPLPAKCGELEDGKKNAKNKYYSEMVCISDCDYI